MKKAVILLSGGLDSTTCLAIATQQQFACHALSINYGQRHIHELQAASAVAQQFSVAEHRTICIDFGQFGGSALTDPSLAVPCQNLSKSIPITYVPARNTMLLALALGYAEVIGAFDIFIGANAVDYSNYPDCRPAFIAAFQQLAQVATKAGVEGGQWQIHAPLMHLKKAEIITLGSSLGVDYSITTSCYQLDEQGAACGQCASCVLRSNGFAAANMADPTKYSR